MTHFFYELTQSLISLGARKGRVRIAQSVIKARDRKWNYVLLNRGVRVNSGQFNVVRPEIESIVTMQNRYCLY